MPVVALRGLAGAAPPGATRVGVGSGSERLAVGSLDLEWTTSLGGLGELHFFRSAESEATKGPVLKCLRGIGSPHRLVNIWAQDRHLKLEKLHRFVHHKRNRETPTESTTKVCCTSRKYSDRWLSYIWRWERILIWPHLVQHTYE